MAKRRDKNEEKYRAALEGKEIPVLTLDNKWHKLFTQAGSNARIESLSRQLNELVKTQGRLGSEMKDIRHLKKKLMDNIVASMDAMDKSPEVDRKVEESGRLIEECNEKLDGLQKEYQALPEKIDKINYELMLATMKVCYDRLKQNTEEINEIGAWITQTRIELKKKILRKQEDEIANRELYSYMHDIFGAEVIEIFDMQYNPGLRDQEKKKEE